MKRVIGLTEGYSDCQDDGPEHSLGFVPVLVEEVDPYEGGGADQYADHHLDQPGQEVLDPVDLETAQQSDVDHEAHDLGREEFTRIAAISARQQCVHRLGGLVNLVRNELNDQMFVVL